MKILSVLVLLFVGVTSLSQTTITGSFDNSKDGDKLYLSKLVQNQAQVIDSSIVKSGNFNFRIKPTDVAFYHVGPASNNFLLLVLGKKKEEIVLSGDFEKLNQTYKVRGSVDNTLINNFLMHALTFMLSRDSLNQQFSQPGANQMAIKNQMNILTQDFFNYMNDFVVSNRTSPAALMALQYINPQQNIDLFKMIAEGAQISMPGSFYAVNLKAQLDNMIIPGNMAPDIAYPDTSGNVRKLSDLKGKVVLLDFWASWCGPCRKENPSVVRLYNKYKEQGFEIFSVSLDKDESRWEAAIIADGLIWPNHVSDLKQWQSEPARLYGVTGIPYTVLIDADGRIIATKLRGPALEQKLQEIFGT